MVYVKHFNILGIETSQIPCIELQGEPNAATVGAVGLLGIDVTSEGREIYVCTKVEGAIYTWQPLKDGKDGASVIKSEIDGNGDLVFTLSDGTTLNAGAISGLAGAKGEDGVGITNVQLIEGRLVISLSNGNVMDLGNVVGAAGADGKDGVDGDNGVSIIKVEKNDAYELIVTLSNGVVMNLGSIKSDYVKTAEYARDVDPTKLPLVVYWTMEPISPISEIVAGYSNSFRVQYFNREPIVGEVFYGVGRTSRDGSVFSYTARVTGYANDDYGYKCATFEMSEVVLLRSTSEIPIVANATLNMRDTTGATATQYNRSYQDVLDNYNSTDENAVLRSIDKSNLNRQAIIGDKFFITAITSDNYILGMGCVVRSLTALGSPFFKVIDIEIIHNPNADGNIKIGDDYYTVQIGTANAAKDKVVTFVLED